MRQTAKTRRRRGPQYQTALVGRKKGSPRAAVANQLKSPSGASFMAKLEDPVAVEGKPVVPKGTLVKGHLERFRRAV
jgi:hypothetical protein